MKSITAFVFKLGIPYSLNKDFSFDQYKSMCVATGKSPSNKEYSEIKNTKVEQVVLFSDTMSHEMLFFKDNQLSLVNTIEAKYDDDVSLDRVRDELSQKHVKVFIDAYKPKFKYTANTEKPISKPHKAYVIKSILNTVNYDYSSEMVFDISSDDEMESNVIRFETTIDFLNRFIDTKTDLYDFSSDFYGSGECETLISEYENSNSIETECLIYSPEENILDITEYETYYVDENGNRYQLTLEKR